MAKRCYYEILEVERTVSGDELKKAYRRLAMKYHPDRNPDDPSAEEKFKEAKEAFETLSDPQKRAAYDQFGHAGVNAGMGGGRGGFGGGGAGFADIFGEVFGDIFGGGGGRSRAHRGADMQYHLKISLEEAVRGTTVEIQIPSTEPCDVCHGTGAKPGTGKKTCGTCHGTGAVRVQQGFFSIQQTCPTCGGSGEVIEHPCEACHGAGRVETQKTLSIKIPAGVDTGDRLRHSGEGGPGEQGGPAGDLYVLIEVKPHPIFQRQDADLLCEMPISFVTAALGGEIEVPTLDGRIALKIPAETQTGKVFRLRGKGVQPVRGGAKGDLLVTVHVETPVKLTNEQKELLLAFERSLIGEQGGEIPAQHRPRERSWLDSVKRFFDDLRGE